MYIISKFTDYYDTVSNRYMDREIVYKREHSVLAIKDREDIPVVDNFLKRLGTEYYRINFSIIGFCGQLIPVVTLKKDGDKKTVGFYNLEDFKKYVSENKLDVLDSHRHRSRWWRWSVYDFSIQEVELFFKNREKFEKLNDYFVKHNTPVFVVRTEENSFRGLKLSLNPMLSNYSFAKVKDPYTAHQDIYTYVSGYLNQPTNSMVQISNEDKIHKHGFDKHSFRKLPQKK